MSIFSEEQPDLSINIMLANTSNTNKQNWHPDHFVSGPMIDCTKQSSETASSGRPPFKKNRTFLIISNVSHMAMNHTQPILRVISIQRTMQKCPRTLTQKLQRNLIAKLQTTKQTRDSIDHLNMSWVIFKIPDVKC